MNIQYVYSFCHGNWINFIPRNTCNLITITHLVPFFERESLGGIVTPKNILSIQIVCHRLVIKF